MYLEVSPYVKCELVRLARVRNTNRLPKIYITSRTNDLITVPITSKE